MERPFTMLLMIHLMLVALFIALGVLFLNGKGADLIAGYTSAPASEKARYDEKALCRFMGKFMFALAGCDLVAASGEIFREMALLWVGIGLFFAVIAAGVVYMNTGKRFQKPEK